MREIWSILVITSSTDGGEIKMKVIDFGSPAWAKTAQETINSTHVANLFIKAILLF